MFAQTNTLKMSVHYEGLPFKAGALAIAINIAVLERQILNTFGFD